MFWNRGTNGTLPFCDTEGHCSNLQCPPGGKEFVFQKRSNLSQMDVSEIGVPQNGW